jgi:hypothetical protein
MIHRFRAAAAIVLLAVAGGCGDSTLPDDEGVMRFEYSGARSGSFSTRGREARAFFSSIRTTIVAQQVTGGMRTQMGFVVGGQTEGTYEFHSLGPTDAEGTLSFGPAGELFTESFVIHAGAVTITEITRERVRGRFEVSARKGFENVITVTGGTFDVPIGPEFPDLPGS